jgi:hypothetical protein
VVDSVATCPGAAGAVVAVVADGIVTSVAVVVVPLPDPPLSEQAAARASTPITMMDIRRAVMARQ